MQPFHPVIQNIIDTVTWKETVSTPEILKFRGFDREGFGFNKLLNRQYFELIEAWSDSYTATWFSDALWATASYCEGDIGLYLFVNEEEYKKDIIESHQYRYESSDGSCSFSSFFNRSPIAQSAVDSIPGAQEELWRKVRLYAGGYYQNSIIWIGDNAPDALDFAEQHWEPIPSYKRDSISLVFPGGSRHTFLHEHLESMRQQYPRTENV